MFLKEYSVQKGHRFFAFVTFCPDYLGFQAIKSLECCTIQGLSHDTIMFRWCLYPKYTVGCLVFTIPLALLSTVKSVLVAPAVVKSVKAILDEVSI